MTSDPTNDRPTSTTDAAPTPPAATPPQSSSSTWIWVLLVLGVLANITASAVLHNVYVSSATGLVVLGCVAALVLRARAARHGG
jgi:uncharacterized membrane protein HdeD (DUF308 family)